MLEIGFADGTWRRVDIATLVRPEGVFADIHAPGFVSAARVNPDTGTIEWPGGGDLSPETLYQAGTAIRRGTTTAA